MSAKAKKILDFLKRSKTDHTYGELAKKFKSSGMAVGQICKSLGNQGFKKYTKKVKAAA